MTLPPIVTDFLNNAAKIHAVSLGVKVLGIVAALGVGIFGHDWSSASAIALAALGTSTAASVAAKQADKKT